MQTKNQRVAIIGGGVAGLTAAHELALRGFEVVIFEANAIAGGKCASQVHRSKILGCTLPAEHGFRYFPGFYEHVVDTMDRIPDDPMSVDPKAVSVTAPLDVPKVSDQLHPTNAFGVAYRGGGVEPVLRSKFGHLGEKFRFLKHMFSYFLGSRAVPTADSASILANLMRYYSACDDRRLSIYERSTLWEFMDGPSLSPETQRLLDRVPQALVAMDARAGNARTFLDTSFLIAMDYISDRPIDRTLRGPTTDVWITPWVAWLRQLGVRFEFNTPIHELRWEGNRVDTVVAADGEEHGDFDFVVLAVPLEVAAQIIDDVTASKSSALDRIRQIDQESWLSWMVGAQLYLKRDRPVFAGHVNFVDAEWGVTGISQRQFWQDHRFPVTTQGPAVKGLLSVVATDWMDTPGPTTGKLASECTQDEILTELLAQMSCCDVAGPSGLEPAVTRDDVLDWHLDESLSWSTQGLPSANSARLMVHPPNHWSARPEADLDLDNLVIASDFVRNSTDLATMEGANEAARHAVNAVLKRTGFAGPRCMTKRHLDDAEPSWLKGLKARDQFDFDRDPLGPETSDPNGIKQALTKAVGTNPTDPAHVEQEAFKIWAELTR